MKSRLYKKYYERFASQDYKNAKPMYFVSDIDDQETLKDIYDMKQAENIIDNDYIIRLTEEVENDKEFFVNECNINHELYDPEVAEYLNGFKKLNEKFMYLA